jgi:prevent-host-death family protein
MSAQVIVTEAICLDEPTEVAAYSEVIRQVASNHRPVIVRRNGEAFAAVIPLEHWELLRELLARQEVDRLAAQIDMDLLVRTHRPPQAWFDGDEPKPF